MLGGDADEFGACQVRIADRKFEPPADVRGDVARIYLYMHAAYPGRGIISNKNATLFAAWNASDPVDAFECALYRNIKALQGNENEILRDACAGNGPPATTSEPQPQEVKASRSDTSDDFSCRPKKTCKDMDSCEEAYFRLKKCGQKQLDRDHDGIPCETLCGEE